MNYEDTVLHIMSAVDIQIEGFDKQSRSRLDRSLIWTALFVIPAFWPRKILKNIRQPKQYGYPTWSKFFPFREVLKF